MSELQNDFAQRFVFDEIDARGCYVRLQQTIADIQSTHHYPDNLARVLNEFALSAVLLRDSIKLDGSVTIQLRTSGAIQLIIADCLADKRVRAIAEFDAERLAPADRIDLSALGDGAVMAITIKPEKGERYQSIVPIERSSLQACLEDYFLRSEQLPSWFKLIASTDNAVGIALHALPQQKGEAYRAAAQSVGAQPLEAEPAETLTEIRQDFDRLKHLLSTLRDDEAVQLDSQQVLGRLFHGESCRVFDKTPVEFGCECTVQKSLDAIRSLGQQDVSKLIQEQQEKGQQSLVVDCHFCFQRYEFDFDQLDGLFGKPG